MGGSRYRWKTRNETPPRPTILVIGPIGINTLMRSVATSDGKIIRLTNAEYACLERLASNAGTAVDRETLAAAAHLPYVSESRPIDQIMYWLRRKLPREADGGHLIHTVRHAGYLLRRADYTA